MERVLITGCSGFLASHLTADLKNAGAEILGVTEENYTTGEYRVQRADIREGVEMERIVKDFLPRKIYHLAAVSNVGFSWKNPSLTYEVNLIGSSNLLEAAKKYSPEARIILMSSAEVYAPQARGKLTEKSDLAPDNPYALSKLAMEMAADLIIRSEGMDIIKVRSFNFTGPGQNKSFVAPDFASQIAAIEMGKSDPVIRVGNLSAVRDFSDVRDISRYLRSLAESGRQGEVYNLCSGHAYSISDILNTLLRLSRAEIRVEVEQSRYRPVDKPYLAGDPSKIRDEMGLVPAYDLEKTLSDLLDLCRTEI